MDYLTTDKELHSYKGTDKYTFYIDNELTLIFKHTHIPLTYSLVLNLCHFSNSPNGDFILTSKYHSPLQEINVLKWRLILRMGQGKNKVK